MAIPPVLLPGKFQGQRSLVGYHPWCHKEADTTEQLALSLLFILLPQFRLHYKATVMKCYEMAQKQTHRSMGQNGGPRNEPTYIGSIYITKEARCIQQRKDSLFDKSFWQNGTATHKGIKLEHFLTPYTKINSNLLKTRND